MTSRRWAGLGIAVGVSGLLLALHAWNAVSAEPSGGDTRASVAAAREKAKLMHSIYASTLDVMHHHYFRNNRAVLPARALEEVFTELEAESKVKARWIAVNTKAMSVNHEAKSAFEKKAAAEIAKGEEAFEAVEEGYYRRAAPIPLGGGCISCHKGLFAGASKSPAFAGLVISVPLTQK